MWISVGRRDLVLAEGEACLEPHEVVAHAPPELNEVVQVRHPRAGVGRAVVHPLPAEHAQDLLHGHTVDDVLRQRRPLRALFSQTTALFEFGHGLSYTTFRYANLRVWLSKILPGGPVRVNVNVRNTGPVAGKEVVRLYLNDVVSTVTTLVKALRRFEDSSSMWR